MSRSDDKKRMRQRRQFFIEERLTHIAEVLADRRGPMAEGEDPSDARKRDIEDRMVEEDERRQKERKKAKGDGDGTE